MRPARAPCPVPAERGIDRAVGPVDSALEVAARTVADQTILTR
jgi:hypothetical protein